MNLREASHTFRGHIVFLGIPMAITFLILGVKITYEEGTLTLPWLLWYLCVCAALSFAAAAACWFTITEPYLRKRAERDDTRH
jgi:hypothetical protein